MTNEKLSTYMQFSEIGVFAQDPDDGEILYAYANAGERGDYLPEYGGAYTIEENFWIDIYTANIEIIQVTCTEIKYAVELVYDNSRSGLKADNVQDAIDELSGGVYELDCIFFHGLNTYPDVLLIEMGASDADGDVGYGIGPYGIGPYGIGAGAEGEPGESNKIPCGVTYINKKSIKLSTGRNYGPIDKVRQITDHEYVICFLSGTILRAILITTGFRDGSTGAPPAVVAGVRSYNRRDGDILVRDSDIPATIARKSEVPTIGVGTTPNGETIFIQTEEDL